MAEYCGVQDSIITMEQDQEEIVPRYPIQQIKKRNKYSCCCGCIDMVFLSPLIIFLSVSLVIIPTYIVYSKRVF